MSAEIDEYPSLRFQDIRKKNKVSDGHTDGQRENSKYHHKQSLGGGGYKYMPDDSRGCSKIYDYLNVRVPPEGPPTLMHLTIVFDHYYCIKTYREARKLDNFEENALANSCFLGLK